MRQGVEIYDIGDGTCIGFGEDSKADINWDHVDGPLLYCRDGSIHWLTWFERFCLYFGFIDINYLDKKYGQYHKYKRVN